MSGAASGTPVHVGCKHPLGLVLRVGEASVTLKGSNSSHVIGGHGVTSVPSDFWDAWLSKYKDSDIVKKRIVFAHKTVALVEGEAKEREKFRTGLEPLVPDDAKNGVATMGKDD